MENNESTIITKIGSYSPITISDFISDNTDESTHINICKSIFNLKENEKVTITLSSSINTKQNSKYIFLKCSVDCLDSELKFCTTDRDIKRYLTGNVRLKVENEDLRFNKNNNILTLPIEYISIDTPNVKTDAIVDLLLNSDGFDLKNKLSKVVKTKEELRNLSLGDEILLDSETIINTYIHKDKKHLLSDTNYKDLKVIFKINDFIVRDDDEIILNGCILLDKCDKKFLDYIHLLHIKDINDGEDIENIVSVEFNINSPILVINRFVKIESLLEPNKIIYSIKCEELSTIIKEHLCQYKQYFDNLQIPELTNKGVRVKRFKIRKVDYSVSSYNSEIVISVEDNAYDKPISIDIIRVSPNKKNIKSSGVSYDNVCTNIRNIVSDSLEHYTKKYIKY